MLEETDEAGATFYFFTRLCEVCPGSGIASFRFAHSLFIGFPMRWREGESLKAWDCL
jgi:hypothetical protein